MRRAPAKAYKVKIGKTQVVVTPDGYRKLCDGKQTSAAWSAMDIKDRIEVESIKGRTKFELSPAAEIKKIRDILVAANPKAKAIADERNKRDNERYKVYAAKRDKEEAEKLKKRKAELSDFIKKNPLPMNLKISDLVAPAYKDRKGSSDLGRAIGGFDYDLDHVEIWFSDRFGWVVPTLTIRNARQYSDAKRRTYAVALSDGTVCRVGMGPHIQKSASIYLTKKNLQRLKLLIARVVEGSIKANNYRDDLSTRRARRSLFY